MYLHVLLDFENNFLEFVMRYFCYRMPVLWKLGLLRAIPFSSFGEKKSFFSNFDYQKCEFLKFLKI